MLSVIMVQALLEYLQQHCSTERLTFEQSPDSHATIRFIIASDQEILGKPCKHNVVIAYFMYYTTYDCYIHEYHNKQKHWFNPQNPDFLAKLMSTIKIIAENSHAV